jgi:hypothetical protein
MKSILNLSALVLCLTMSFACTVEPDSGTTTTPPDGGVTPPDGNNPPGGPVTSPTAAWVVRPAGNRTVEFNPAYLACAIAGTCATLTSVDQINALIASAPSEARMAGECAAVTPVATGWVDPSGHQIVLHKDATTGWYRVDGGLNGVSNSTCNVSYPAVGAIKGDERAWPMYGTAPLSDLGSHTGGPGMYCNLDNSGHSTGCAIEYFLDSNGTVVLSGQLPNGP